MFANERRVKIAEMVARQQSVTVAELMEQFDVSIETIRRDLECLEKQRVLSRVHGGAITVRKMQRFTQLSERISENRESKRQLSLTAAELIEEGDRIAIDSGSTAIELAQVLRERFRELTIVTNSPEVFDLLCPVEGFRLIQAGGFFLREENAFCGHLTVDTLRGLHVSKTLLFPSAVSLQYGIGVYIPELLEVQRAFMEIADETIALADSSKFETTAALKLCSLSSIHRFVTDSALSDAVYRRYLEKGIPLLR